MAPEKKPSPRKTARDHGRKTPESSRSTPGKKPSGPTPGKRPTQTQINRGLRAVWHLVQKCHRQRRKRGWYSIEFTIDGTTGKVTEATASESAGDSHTAECLRKAVSGARFAPFTSASVTLLHRFDFR